MVRHWSASKVYLTFTGVMGLLNQLVFTVFMLYMAVEVGLDPLQLVLTGTALEVTVMLFEVPTGLVADVKSRRLSVITGMFGIGLGYFTMGVFTNFALILIAQVIWGIGWTFISGAQDAWITDEVGEESAAKLFIRSNQLRQIGGLAGIGLSVLLGLIALNLPIIIAGIAFWGLGIFLILTMPENGFKPAPRENRATYHAMFDTFKKSSSLIRASQVILTMMAITFFFGLFSEGFDRLWVKHVLDYFTLPKIWGLDNVVWFGLIAAVSRVLTIILSEVMVRRVDTSNPRHVLKILWGISFVLFISLLTFAQARWFGVALVAYWMISILRTLDYPLFMAWLNQNIRSEYRATMMSSVSQLDAVGQIAGGPVIGMIGSAFSTRVAITISSLLLSPVLWLYLYAIRHQDSLDAALVVDEIPPVLEQVPA